MGGVASNKRGQVRLLLHNALSQLNWTERPDNGVVLLNIHLSFLSTQGSYFPKNVKILQSQNQIKNKEKRNVFFSFVEFFRLWISDSPYYSRSIRPFPMEIESVSISSCSKESEMVYQEWFNFADSGYCFSRSWFFYFIFIFWICEMEVYTELLVYVQIPMAALLELTP